MLPRIWVVSHRMLLNVHHEINTGGDLIFGTRWESLCGSPHFISSPPSFSPLLSRWAGEKRDKER